MNAQDWFKLFLLATLWGCSFMLMEISLESIPLLTTLFFRVGIAGLLLLVASLLMKESITMDGQFLVETTILSIFRVALPIALILWAQLRIDSGLAGILNSTSALFTLLFVHFLTAEEKITRTRTMSLVAGMAGVTLIIGIDALRGLNDQIAGQLAMLGATACYGFGNAYSRKFSHRSPTFSASVMLITAAVIVLPFVTYFDWAQIELPKSTAPTTRSIIALLALAVLSTALAFVVWFKLVRSAGPNNTVLVTFLIPPIALILGITFLAETPELSDIAGLVLIGIGLWFSQRVKSSSG